MGVTVHQAYRFALDPTSRQEQMLRSHAGAARFAWNWGLARCKERYTAERRWYSGQELHKLWNVEKKADPDLAWWKQNSKWVYQEAFRNLDRAHPVNDCLAHRATVVRVFHRRGRPRCP